MQQFLAGEQFFVGQNVINFDVVKLVFHGDVEGFDVLTWCLHIFPHCAHG